MDSTRRETVGKAPRPDHMPIEPLAESAPLMYQMARQFCELNAGSDSRCDYYHAAWQYLRALGLIKKLGGHPQFMMDVLADLARAEEWSRVLIGGAADYSMAAHILHAYRNSELDLTLVDRCKSPLAINEWYCGRLQRPITLVQGEISGYETNQLYDVVVASSLLGNFSVEQRKELFRRFSILLRPRGKLVFTNQIDRPADGFWRFDESAVNKIGRAAREAATTSFEQFRFDPDFVEQLALEYGRERRIHLTPSQGELRQNLLQAGFELERFEIVEEPGRPGEQISGPSMDHARRDARVIAVRL